MTKAKPLPSGTPRRNCSMASRPPADAPIATTVGVAGGSDAHVIAGPPHSL